MGRVKQLLIEMEDDEVGAAIAEAIGIDHFDLIQMDYKLDKTKNKYGLYHVEFSPDTDKDKLAKIENLEGLIVYIDPYDIDYIHEPYYYAEFEVISSNKRYYQTFLNEIENLAQLNNLETPTQKLEIILKRQIFVSIITALETFLSETFINLTLDNEHYFKKFVLNHQEFKTRKFELKDIFESFEKIKDTAKKIMLDTIYHHLPKVREMYRFTFEIDFPSIGEVNKLINIRHDLVHRNGKTKTGKLHAIDKQEVSKAIVDVTNFVEKIAKSLDLKGIPNLTDD